MDVFKTQFEQIKKQFNALTPSQKMLVMTLIAVMGLTLVYWSKYAGSSEMVTLLNGQTLTAEEIGNIDGILRDRGIEHTVGTGNVLVPAEHKTEALGVLMYSHALPSNTRSAFEEMSKSLTAFSPSTEREAVYTQALNKEMASVIAGFPGVASAKVVISAKSEHLIEGSVPPTAMVSIVTKPGGDLTPDKLARAAADGLAGAVSELTAAHVSVIIDGVPKRFTESANGGGYSGDEDEKRKKFQEEREGDIRKRFNYITGLTVVVNCDVENKIQSVDQMIYDPKGVVTVVQEQIEQHTESQNEPAKNGEPGVGPNTGTSGANGAVSVGGGGETPMASSTSSNGPDTTINNNYVPSTHTKTDIPAGKATSVSAAVGVPLSWIKSDYRGEHTGAKEPTSTEWKDIIKEKIAGVRETVSKVIGVKMPGDIAVDMYVDAPPEVLMPTTAAPSAAMALLSAHGKEIGVGVLAVVSLFLMVTMVRKSSTVTVMTSAGPMTISNFEAANASSGANNTGPGASPNFVASTGSGALDGMELGDEDVRTQQMLDQVTTMVKENPDGAAALVKRWLTRA